MDRDTAIRLRDFIVDRHWAPASQTVALASVRFGIQPAAIRYHIRKLIADGVLVAEGNTRARRYILPRETLCVDEITVGPDTQDDIIWREYVKPALEKIGASQNVVAAMRHGCTEMFNNVIDHSGTEKCEFFLESDRRSLMLTIRDRGIGIFEKIRRDCDLPDRRLALLELSKGKLTSDPSRHTGEGIFFTSRIFDRFYLFSLDLELFRARDGENWLLDTKTNEDDIEGTRVTMEIKHDSDVDIPTVFRRFEDDDYKFVKTHVPVYLAKFGDEELVSRSQARRLMARVEKFSEVLLDFEGVASIGQAFSDEVFRVWSAEHPETDLLVLNANPEVTRMVRRARAHES